MHPKEIPILTASWFNAINVTRGNPFAHLGKIQRPPPDVIVKKLILTDLTDMYILESISSPIYTYFGSILSL